ncbi:MAG: DUF4062 domain-containing protein [Lewinellaceae bacterium]|nr:DUF4062 domain-containing protein [Lewinellaceae bacterium]
MPAQKIQAMISSTARDLPEHRKEALDACLRQSTAPLMMEHLPASDEEAIGASLKLVEEADIYIGIFAHRYGYVPKGHEISITEMEYKRAVARDIPRLIFLMDKEHPITIEEVEVERAAELKAFKTRLQEENIVNFFKSPADLRAHLINSLSQRRDKDPTAYHYVSDIPQPPEAYIAHPYTLLQAHRLVGRQRELNLLTDWVVKTKKPHATIFNVVAIGGMGKSALTWKWFNDIAPQEMNPLAGRLWWSFYESDARFENFIIRALAYVSRRSREEVEKMHPSERERQLLDILDKEPFLLVLDGLERILLAYARMDAARLADDEIEERTANFVANVYGLPESAAQSYTGQHRLRKTTDPRAGMFLRRLAQVKAANILVSTRLYPAELQAITGEPIRGCSGIFLSGLNEDDALNLWRAFGVSGSREALLPLFRRFERHPLLLQSLASEVAHFRRAPGDFDAWKKAHPAFNPFELPLVQARTHVLEFALRGLDGPARKALQVIAGFRMPASYDTLAALFVGDGQAEEGASKLFPSETGLDHTLKELEDRGLLGWDKRANRYDLHPIVRGVVWSVLKEEGKREVFSSLQAHFEAVPKIENYLDVNRLEDLTPAIELYNTLIGLERYEEAYIVWRDRLDDATLYRLSAGRQRVELLEMLFPDGVDRLPRLSKPDMQAFTLNALALSGQPGRAAPLFRKSNEIDEQRDDKQGVSIGLGNLSNAQQLAGALRESEAAARRALAITGEQEDRFWEAANLQWLGLTLAARGLHQASGQALQRSLRLLIARSEKQSEGLTSAYLAQRALWLGEPALALPLATRAWELASYLSLERDFIRAARLQGAAALALENYPQADERLHHALTRARAVNLVEEELPALLALAELRRHQGQPAAARELLDGVWELAERGPYPLVHADACNVLAQLERDAGNEPAAVEAAIRAYELAWCDGPPYAYHWGLEKAKQHLKELGAGAPELPPFDESKYEPMVEVEINPKDEFFE